MDQNEMTSRIMDAMRAPRYTDVRESDRLSGLARLLYDEYARKGQSAAGADDLAYRLDRDVCDHYGRQVTLPEVLLALRWGLRGEYGEFTGLNTDRLFRFVRSFIESGERREAARLLSVPSSSRERTLSADERGLLNWNAMLDEFRSECAYWQEHRQVEAVHPGRDTVLTIRRVLTGSCYRWLKSLGLVAADADTLSVETGKRDAAARLLSRTGAGRDLYSAALSGHTPSPVLNLVHSMMMEEYFLNCERAGIDPADVMAGLEGTPEDERRWSDD